MKGPFWFWDFWVRRILYRERHENLVVSLIPGDRNEFFFVFPTEGTKVGLSNAGKLGK